MGNIILKEGSDIFVRVGDISFKGKIHSTNEQAKRIDIEVPLQWLYSFAAVDKGKECSIMYKSDTGKNYLTGVSSVIEKMLNSSPPLLGLHIPEKIEERKELRKYKRIGVSIFTGITHREELVDGHLVEKQLNGTVVDISLGGCQVLTDNRFKNGEFLALNFGIRENEELRIRCQVRNSRSFYESRLSLYGVEFVNLEEDVKGKLESFIASLS
jgi:c-di-GMP-binding flagellar brake protein YcgR